MPILFLGHQEYRIRHTKEGWNGVEFLQRLSLFHHQMQLMLLPLKRGVQPSSAICLTKRLIGRA